MTPIATLRIGTTRIGLRGLDLPFVAGVSVELRSLSLGKAPGIAPLS